MNSQAITANADSRTGSALMMNRLGAGRSVELRGEFQSLAHESQMPQSGMSRPSVARVFLGLRRQSSCSAFGSPPGIACANSFRAQVRGVLFELLPAQVFGGFVAFDRPGAEVAREEVSRQGSVRVGLCPAHHSSGNGIPVIHLKAGIEIAGRFAISCDNGTGEIDPIPKAFKFMNLAGHTDGSLSLGESRAARLSDVRRKIGGSLFSCLNDPYKG